MAFTDNWSFDLGWCNTNNGIASVLRPENVIFYEQSGVVEIPTIYHPEGIQGWTYINGLKVYSTKYFSSGVMRSNEKYLYGTFECEMFLPDFRGSWPAFWLYEEADGLYDEIDWFEQFRKDNCLSKHRLQSGIIKKVNGKETHLYKSKRYLCPINSRKTLRVKGYWDENVIQFYLNGKLVFEVTGQENISHQPMRILVDEFVGNWEPKLSKTKSNSLLLLNLTHNGISLI